MIRIDLPADASAAERWAVETLVDLSCLLRVAPTIDGVMTLSIADGAGYEVEGSVIRVGRETLARVVDVAGAAIEQRSKAADKHQRVPAEVNPLAAEGKERRPVMQQLARKLRDRVAEASGNGPFRTIAPWPDGHRWAAVMTHDLDVVSGWPLFTALRCLELFKKGRAGDLLRVLGAAAGALGGDPVFRSLQEVLRVERELGIHSTWFILVGDPTLARWWQGDVTYRLESPEARAALEAIRADGHELGLHGSMQTFTDTGAFQQERARLGAMTNGAAAGVRQHFLKMRPGLTQAAMQQAGFRYDATFGFSGRNGFRLGVADVVRGWNERAQAASPIALVPLHWMDRALSKYQGVEDPAALVDDGLRLADEVRAAEGLWVGLWHPNLDPALGYPGAPAEFARMMRTLWEGDPWFATLSEIVDWRAQRRGVVARSVAPDGRVELDGAGRAIVLEERDGRKAA